MLPGFSTKPIGGYKVIYEYANFFASKGHDVTIYESRTNKMEFEKASFKGKARLVVANILFKINFLKYERPQWFHLSDKIHVEFSPLMENHKIKNADVIIATSLQTSNFVFNLNNSKGVKFYFIQHFETFLGTKKEVISSWHLPMTKIVIASWLQNIAANIGIQTYLVKNFVDNSTFSLNFPIDMRETSVAMLYHKLPVKGTEIGLQVLERISTKFPSCRVRLFGVYDKPQNLPKQFEYFKNADTTTLRDKIYNRSQIFLSTSRSEGWGLTSTEAMACGAALVSTKNGGVNDFGIDNETAMLADVDDINEIEAKVTKLLVEDELRIRIASAGQKLVSKLTIENSGNEFLKIMRDKFNEK